MSLKTHLSTVAEDNPELIVDASLSEPNDELNILHQAAKILRARVLKTKTNVYSVLTSSPDSKQKS